MFGLSTFGIRPPLAHDFTQRDLGHDTIAARVRQVVEEFTASSFNVTMSRTLSSIVRQNDSDNATADSIVKRFFDLTFKPFFVLTGIGTALAAMGSGDSPENCLHSGLHHHSAAGASWSP
jgi:hypothetical protein